MIPARGGAVVGDGRSRARALRGPGGRPGPPGAARGRRGPMRAAAILGAPPPERDPHAPIDRYIGATAEALAAGQR